MRCGPASERPCRRSGKYGGQGRTLLIGGFPGAGYFKHPTAQAHEFFAGLLDWAGIARTLTVSDPLVKARLHRGASGSILYVVNPTREERPLQLNCPR